MAVDLKGLKSKISNDQPLTDEEKKFLEQVMSKRPMGAPGPKGALEDTPEDVRQLEQMFKEREGRKLSPREMEMFEDEPLPQGPSVGGRRVVVEKYDIAPDGTRTIVFRDKAPENLRMMEDRRWSEEKDKLFPPSLVEQLLKKLPYGLEAYETFSGPVSSSNQQDLMFLTKTRK